MLSPLLGFGLVLDVVGAILIGIGLVGRSRLERVEDGLRNFLKDLSTPLVPASFLNVFLVLFYHRRATFSFFVLSPFLLLPSYARLVYDTVPLIPQYLDLVLSAWFAVGSFTLLLTVPATLLWLITLRRSRFPLWVDHMVAVAAFPWRWSLIFTLPAVIVFVGIPLVANFVVVKIILYCVLTPTAFLAHLSLRQSRAFPHIAGIILLILGFAIQLYASP